MTRFAILAGIALGLALSVYAVPPVPQGVPRPLSQCTLPASAFAAAPVVSQPLGITQETTRFFRTPWGEIVAIDSRASRVPLVSNWGWTIYANGDVSTINGAANGSNPLIQIQ